MHRIRSVTCLVACSTARAPQEEREQFAEAKAAAEARWSATRKLGDARLSHLPIATLQVRGESSSDRHKHPTCTAVNRTGEVGTSSYPSASFTYLPFPMRHDLMQHFMMIVKEDVYVMRAINTW